MPEITYSGLSRVPSDYECADGQLALSLNLVPENGSLQPVFPPSLIFTLPKGYKVAYIHKTTTFTHYIITKKDDTVNDYRQKYDDDGNPIYDDDGNPVMEEETSPDIYYLDEKNIPESKDVTFNDLIELDGIDGTEIIAIEAIGNTLIVVTDTTMNYYLWKVEEDGTQHYIYLGTHLPELDLSFGLQGEVIREVDEDYHDTQSTSSGETVMFFYGFEVKLAENINSSELYDELSDENKSKVTESVLAQVNKFIADHSTNAGKFLFPFFVRYAYRLYDDSLTMHSAPILMLTCSKCAPTVFVNRATGSNNEIDTLCCTVAGVVHTLDYRIESIDTYKQLKETWGDIVKSVDIFVSAPLYTYDQSGEIKKLIELPTTVSIEDEEEGYTVCKPLLPKDQKLDSRQQSTSSEGGTSYVSAIPYQWEGEDDDYYFLNQYCRLPIASLYIYSFFAPAAEVELPCKTEEIIKEDIRSCCNFYLLRSINVEELAEYDDEGEMLYTRIKLNVAEDYLQSLVNREQMTDDYDSHDNLISSHVYNYNSRLNIANITKTLYRGYTPSSLFCFGDGYTEVNGTAWTGTSKLESIESNIDCIIYTYINQDAKQIVVQSQVDKTHAPITYVGGKYLFVYYPNTNAYKAMIDMEGTTGARFEVSLEPHDFLNGAFYFGGWSNPATTQKSLPKTTSDQTVLVANKIYNSEINNPFFFPVEQIVTVGTGTILGIATAAKALSQGQFGSFPLYAFCDDGVWALSISSEGVYSAVQPITRDVCINAKAITQLDSSVLFPTDRGIMEIAGSNCGCVTDILNGDNAFDLTLLPQYNKLLQLSNISTEVDVKEIREMLEDSVMLYDYINQRIYVCSDDCNIAYVISKKSNSWGMAAVDISSTVNSYPDAYAMTSDGQFVDFSHPDKESPQDCFLITRPMKLESPNGLKTVTAVLQRGYFRRGHLQSALFGSRNLLDWHIVNSSHSHEIRSIAGTPYKYFRIATLAQLEADESIFGATVNATTRFGNKER